MSEYAKDKNRYASTVEHHRQTIDCQNFKEGWSFGHKNDM
jgi:hypothetical protein